MKINYPKVKLEKENENSNVVKINEGELVSHIKYVSSPIIRTENNLQEKSFFLSSYWNWVIAKDAGNNLCLIPLNKNGD